MQRDWAAWGGFCEAFFPRDGNFKVLFEIFVSFRAFVLFFSLFLYSFECILMDRP